MNHGEKIKKDGNLIYLPTGRDSRNRRGGRRENGLRGAAGFRERSGCTGCRVPQDEIDLQRWDLPSSPLD